MNEPNVGIRELKANLSKYLRRVKAGQTVIVTERGVPIGRIVPAAPTMETRMRILVETGLISWNGKKLLPREPVAVNHNTRMVSELVTEDRDVNHLS